MKNGKIRIGVSSCLLGNEVRFDGSHKYNSYINLTLSKYLEFHPFCPEVAIGLGTPRPPIRLIKTHTGVHAVGVKDPELDVTDRLERYGITTREKLEKKFYGFIFKSKSPSCGMERVKVYGSRGAAQSNGTGIFAAAILSGLPDLPVEEEGRLMDPVIRENFIERVFCYSRWHDMTALGLTAARLIDFHTRHKFVLLSHDETAYRELGKIIAHCGKRNIDSIATTYLQQFMAAMKKKATKRRHTNVLMHIAGFFKKDLDADDKKELQEVIHAYRTEEVPLIVPITLLKHYLRKFPNEYIAGQYYIQPHPKELMLRNHI